MVTEPSQLAPEGVGAQAGRLALLELGQGLLRHPGVGVDGVHRLDGGDGRPGRGDLAALDLPDGDPPVEGRAEGLLAEGGLQGRHRRVGLRGARLGGVQVGRGGGAALAQAAGPLQVEAGQGGVGGGGLGWASSVEVSRRTSTWPFLTVAPESKAISRTVPGSSAPRVVAWTATSVAMAGREGCQVLAFTGAEVTDSGGGLKVSPTAIMAPIWPPFTPARASTTRRRPRTVKIQGRRFRFAMR